METKRRSKSVIITILIMLILGATVGIMGWLTKGFRAKPAIPKIEQSQTAPKEVTPEETKQVENQSEQSASEEEAK